MPGDPFYWSAKWKQCRAEHLERFPLCAVCAAIGIETPAQDVDHVKAKERMADPYDHAGLRSVCHRHHSQKTIYTEGAHRNKGKRFMVTGPDGWPIPYGDHDGDQEDQGRR